MANERKKITMLDIAKEAAVSQSTVSRVINRRPGINETKYRKVLEAMKRLGYELPQTVEPARKTVCLVLCPLPEQKNILEMDFNIQAQEGVQTALGNSDADLMLLVQPAGAETLHLPPEKLQSISGFIFLGPVGSPELLKELERARIPYVTAQGGTPLRFPHDCDRVCPDEFETARKICDYLEAHNRKRIGFILSRTFAHRLDGFRLETMKREKLELRENDIMLLETTNNEEHIEAAYHYIRRGDLPDTLIVSHHGAAVLIRSIFKFNNIRVPEDVLIFSYAHTVEQNQLPCVLHRAYLLGYKAARRLLEKLADPDDVPGKVLIPSELININRT
jgi:transcriptional regulator, lacI family